MSGDLQHLGLVSLGRGDDDHLPDDRGDLDDPGGGVGTGDVDDADSLASRISVWVVRVHGQTVHDATEGHLDELVDPAKVCHWPVAHFKVNGHVVGLAGLDSFVQLGVKLGPKFGAVELNGSVRDLK